MENKYQLLTVLGPTACGKTQFATKLAQMLDGEIISADSRQVFRRMDIGTGKDLSEYVMEDGTTIPYHLIDIEEPGERYSVYRFQHDFHLAFNDIVSRGRVPILCGGTGLYIESVIKGYEFDGRQFPPISSLNIGLKIDRDLRREKITRRLDARLREGMVEEIQGLLDSGVPSERLIRYGLEYKFVTLFLLGELSFQEMHDLLEIAIHQFAKRQMTWFRGMEERRGVPITWLDCATPIEERLEQTKQIWLNQTDGE